jgi:ubiquinone biosynthesis protein UbiJ
VISRGEFDEFAASISRLRDDLARLEQRTDRLAERNRIRSRSS